MYTGMYSSQQEATNKRLVRLFELITNIFIKCLKPYKLFPLLKLYMDWQVLLKRTMIVTLHPLNAREGPQVYDI